MTTLLIIAAAVAAFAAAGLFALLSARTFHVFVRLAIAGRHAADEAVKRGDSVAAWWDPAQAPRRAGAQHKFRKARAGRFVRGRGVVAVQEHAPNHR